VLKRKRPRPSLNRLDRFFWTTLRCISSLRRPPGPRQPEQADRHKVSSRKQTALRSSAERRVGPRRILPSDMTEGRILIVVGDVRLAGTLIELLAGENFQPADDCGRALASTGDVTLLTNTLSTGCENALVTTTSGTAAGNMLLEGTNGLSGGITITLPSTPGGPPGSITPVAPGAVVPRTQQLSAAGHRPARYRTIGAPEDRLLATVQSTTKSRSVQRFPAAFAPASRAFRTRVPAARTAGCSEPDLPPVGYLLDSGDPKILWLPTDRSAQPCAETAAAWLL
jgi:hypothetical protein